MRTPRGGRRTIFSWASPVPSKSGSGGKKTPTTPLNPPDMPDATKIKLRIRLIMRKGVSGTQPDKILTRTDTSLTAACRVSKQPCRLIRPTKKTLQVSRILTVTSQCRACRVVLRTMGSKPSTTDGRSSPYERSRPAKQATWLGREAHGRWRLASCRRPSRIYYGPYKSSLSREQASSLETSGVGAAEG